VTAEGNKVNIVFTGNAAPKFDNIITTKILPEHVRSKVSDPAKYVDKKPVVTGPFRVGSYNGRRLVLERRADHWQADKVKVKQLVLERVYDAAKGVARVAQRSARRLLRRDPEPGEDLRGRQPQDESLLLPGQRNNRAVAQPGPETVLGRQVPRGYRLRDRPERDLQQGDVRDHEASEPVRPQLPAAAKYLPSSVPPDSTVTAYGGRDRARLQRGPAPRSWPLRRSP
jgi:hypothetical protein